MGLSKPMHTPEEWKITNIEYNWEGGGVVSISSPTWESMIDVYLHCTGKEEGLANANLVVAAPDMYAALLELKNDGIKSDLVEQAIAKAEGKQ